MQVQCLMFVRCGGGGNHLAFSESWHDIAHDNGQFCSFANLRITDDDRQLAATTHTHPQDHAAGPLSPSQYVAPRPLLFFFSCVVC